MDQDELYSLMVRAVKANPKLGIVKAYERPRQLRLGMFNKSIGEEYYFDLEISREDDLSLIRFSAVITKYPESLAKAAALTLDTFMEYYRQRDSFECNTP